MKKLLLSLLAILLVINTTISTSIVRADDKDSETIVINVADQLLQEGALFSKREEGKSAPSKAPTRSLTVYQVVANAIRNREDSVDISSFGIQYTEASNVYTDVLNSNPDLYYADDNISISYIPETGIITSFDLAYKDFTAEQMAAFDTKVNDILSYVGNDWSILKTIFYLHDWIVLNTVYDLNAENRFNAYGVIIGGRAVCQGYSLTLKLLLNRLGIYCDVVTSEAINHAWNYIEYDGDYYFIDVTWDDPIESTVDYCGHNNLLRSRDGIVSTGHTGTDWLIYGTDGYNVESSDRFDNSAWQNYYKTMYFLNNYGIFVDRNYYANVYDLENETPIKSYLCTNDNWPVFNDPTYSWNGKFYTAVLANGRIYYNTSDSIYEINLVTDATKEIYQLTSGETALGYIYSLTKDGNLLNYELAESPNDDLYTYVDSFDLSVFRHSITYHLNGGTNAPTNDDYYYEGDEFEFDDPSYDGYTFMGWFLDEDFNTPITGISASDDEDIDVYASWQETPIEEKIYNKSQSGTLLSNGTVRLKLSVNVDSSVDLNTAYVLVNGQKTFLSDLTVQGGKLVVTTPAVAPKRLIDNCVIRYYDGDDNPISNTINLSVVAYINALIGVSTSDQAKAFYKSLLNYAAYTQTYFNYNLSNLANAGLSEADKAVPNVTHDDVAGYAMTSTGSTSGIIPIGQALTLNDEISYKVYFQLTGSNSIDDYVFKDNGTALTPVFLQSNVYYVVVNRLAAPDLDKTHTITVTLGDSIPPLEFGETEQEFNVGNLAVSTCVLTYVEITLRNEPTTESETKLANLVKVLYTYCMNSKAVN